MIIARATVENKDDGSTGEMLILGLSDKNVAKLVSGKPMRITRETHGEGIPAGWTIVILHGKTEDRMAEILSEAGWIGPETKINRDPKLDNT